jgi:hypothetical protein
MRAFLWGKGIPGVLWGTSTPCGNVGNQEPPVGRLKSRSSSQQG